MSNAKLTAILGLVGIVAAGTAGYEMLSLRTAVATLARVTNERDSLQSQLRSRGIMDQRQPSEGIDSRLQVLAGRAAALRAAHSQARGTDIDQARLVKYHQRYDQFVTQRGLTPTQADNFFSILAEWDEVGRDFQAAIREQGLAATPAAQQLRNQLQHEIEVKPLENLLGQEGEQAYMAYEGNSFFRAVLDPIAQEMEQSNQPLTGTQMAQAVALVRSNMRQIKDDPTSMSTRAVFDWDTIVVSAGSFLSPAQIVAMQTAVEHTYKHSATH